MTIPNHAEEKRKLRSRMRDTRVDAARDNPRIRDLVAHWLDNHPQLNRIALYHPLPDEPDLLPLLDRFPNLAWHFPRIANDEMTFHPVSSLADDLTRGPFGILQPKASIPAAAPHEIQVFLCPGMAFEPATGLRLGRGKAYYDRYLSLAREDARLIGVTFPERIVDDTYAEPHDIRMHLVLF